jgi:putative addiction module CopG family antidote
MPNIDLGDPYESYVKGLISTGLYSTYAEVVKDALRMHMNNETPSKQMAAIHSAIAEGEQDIKEGRFRAYTPQMLDDMTNDVLKDHG